MARLVVADAQSQINKKAWADPNMKHAMTVKHTVILCMLFLLSSALIGWAVTITLFSDLKTYVERGRDIVIARCISSPPASERNRQKDGLYAAQIEIIKVIKGTKEPGECKVVTVYGMEAGKTYLLYSLGGTVDGTDFLALPELSMVEVPPTFDVKGMDGKPPEKQVLMIFNARLSEVRKVLVELERETRLLEKATDQK